MRLFLIIFTLYICGLLNAQHSIHGFVKDSNKEPIEFVSISISNINQPSRIVSTSTDDKGYYILKNIPTGSYNVQFYSFGFKVYSKDDLSVNANLSIDVTLIEEETQQLQDIVIKAKRPIIRQTAEKLIVDLTNSNMINSNLRDVMKRIPGMVVTQDGLNFAGRSDIRILINGKTTKYMEIKTLLRDFPAEQIASIELIEQPGAEYEAEGSGPIVNIILKKNAKIGTYGSVNVWIGEDEGFEYGSGASISSYKNKINWQANIGQSAPTWREDVFIKRKVGQTTYDQKTIEPFDPKKYWIGGSLDYNLTTAHSVGVGMRFYNSVSDRKSNNTTIISNGNSTSLLLSENSFGRDRSNISINPYYEFKDDKNRLLVDFNYVHYNSDNLDYVYSLPNNTVPFANRKYKQEGAYNIMTYKVDYSRSLKENLKLSFGTKYANVDTDNDLKAFTQRSSSQIFEITPNDSNRFLIDEQIFALYGKLNATIDDWAFSGGLRFEDSKTVGKTDESNIERKRAISKLFPSLALTRKFNKEFSASLAYSYRIQRPSYNSLNAFVQYYDPFSSETGNPNLKPSFTNNYQLNIMYESQPFFTIGYSNTRDDLFEFISQNDTTAQIQRSIINLSNRENLNLRLFGPLSFINKLDGFTGLIVDYNKFNSQDIQPDFNLSKWSWAWYTQASYKLPWQVTFELSSYFSTGILHGQVDSDWLGEIDFSLGKTFFDDKLAVSLALNEILNRGFVGTIDYDNINAKININESKQNVRLRLTYSFGSKYSKKEIKRNSATDEQDRIQEKN